MKVILTPGSPVPWASATLPPAEPCRSCAGAGMPAVNASASLKMTARNRWDPAPRLFFLGINTASLRQERCS